MFYCLIWLKMAHKTIYLDHNASAPLLPSARAAMVEALDIVGNPSSVHNLGRKLSDIIDNARQEVAKATQSKMEQIVFSGSATESITQAIVAGVRVLGIDKIIISAGEHAAALKAAKISGAMVEEVFLLENGLIDLEQLAQKIKQADENNELALICVHQVNNETGIIQPISEIEKMVGPTKHYLFVDAVQGLGKMELNFANSPIDMMAISSHKVGGPVGVGALLVKSHCDEVCLIPGGGQEKHRRGGTQSAALIAGFGKACVEFPQKYDGAHIVSLVEKIESGLKKLRSDVVIFGEGAQRMGNIVNFAVPNLEASVAMMGLDLEGICVSSGSACASGKVTYSHVLCAMGISPNLALGRLRISLGWNSTIEDVNSFLHAFEKILARHKAAMG